MRYKRAAITTLVALVAIVLSVIGYFSSIQAEAPNVTFTTLKGESFDMASLKGKVVLVNFWATDCKSCIAEMPYLVKTYQQYQHKGLEIIAVAMPYDPPAQTVAFAEQKQLPFPVMHDGYGDISHQFGNVNVTPTALLYNQDGKRIQRTIGILNFNKLHALLNKVLQKSS